MRAQRCCRCVSLHAHRTSLDTVLKHTPTLVDPHFTLLCTISVLQHFHRHHAVSLEMEAMVAGWWRQVGECEARHTSSACALSTQPGAPHRAVSVTLVLPKRGHAMLTDGSTSGPYLELKCGLSSQVLWWDTSLQLAASGLPPLSPSLPGKLFVGLHDSPSWCNSRIFEIARKAVLCPN